MCGVFGFVANSTTNTGPDLIQLQKIARVTMSRGPHAFGFAWIDRHGILRMFKQSGRIVDHLGLLAMARGARMLIGHCRYATKGLPADNQNNHPHPVNGGWFVHNGTLHDYQTLVDAYALRPITNCDSELLGLMAEQLGGHYSTNATRMLASVRTLASSPLVTLSLWRNPRSFVAIRFGKPLHLGVHRRATYFGSLAEGLPGTVSEVPDRTMIHFNTKGTSHVTF